MFDSNLMFRTTTGAMTVSESLGPITIYGTPIHGMAVRIEIPSANLNDTVLPTLYASQDGTTYNVMARYRKGAVLCTGGKSLFLRFAIPKGEKTYLKLELSVSINSTTGVFGVVTAGLTVGGGANVDRDVSWSL
jgi:hypothetical protein